MEKIQKNLQPADIHGVRFISMNSRDLTGENKNTNNVSIDPDKLTNLTISVVLRNNSIKHNVVIGGLVYMLL